MKSRYIILIVLVGLCLYSCSTSSMAESPKPAQSIQPAAPEVKKTFNAHLNALIAQLGNYDYKKQRNAAKEIQELIDKFIKATAENPEYDSSDLDYLISAMDYASEKGSPPDKEGVVDPALHALAMEIWKPAKWRLIVHPDLIKLYPQVIANLEMGKEEQTVNWLMTQSKDIQVKGVRLFRLFVKSRDSRIREKSCGCLIALGYIKDILPMLKSADNNVRVWIQEIILESSNASNIQQLLPLLNDDDADVRYFILTVLNQIGDQQIIPDVKPLINDKDSRVRLEAIRIMAKFSDIPTLKEILPMQNSGNIEAREIIIRAIHRLGGDSEIEFLTSLLKDGEFRIKVVTTELLLGAENVSVEDMSLIEKLIPFLKDCASEVKSNWVRALKARGAHNPTILKVMISLLDDKDVYVKHEVVQSIGELGDASLLDNPSILNDLLDALGNGDNLLKTYTIRAMAKLGGDSAIKKYSLKEKLVPLIKDKNFGYSALRLIFLLGGPSVVTELPIENDMLALLNNENEFIKEDAVVAIGKYGDKTLIKYILPLLKDSSGSVRGAVAWSLTQFDDIRAIPVWIDSLDVDGALPGTHRGIDNDGWNTYLGRFNSLAHEGLSKLSGQTIDSNGAEVITKFWKDWWKKEGRAWFEQEFKKINDDTYTEVLNSIIARIDETGDKPTIKDLLPELKNSNDDTKIQTIRAVMFEGNPLYAKDILFLLGDKNARVRYETIVTLEMLDARDSINDILPLLKDIDRDVRMRSLRAVIRWNKEAVKEHPIMKEVLTNLKDKDQRLRREALTILAGLNDKTLIPDILPLLNDNVNKVRWCAAWVLAELHDIRAVPTWIELVNRQGDLTCKVESSSGESGWGNCSGYASDMLQILTHKTMSGKDTMETAKLWKDWWAKEGQKWYEEEVKKIATTDEH